MVEIKNTIFDNIFTVYYYSEMPDTRAFFHINLQDNNDFYNSLYDYFFSEDKLVQYLHNKKGILFNPNRKQYVDLFQHLQNYIDSENILDITNYNKEVISILKQEFPIEKQGDKISIRQDKFGKIGEYIFCNILSYYYNFDCIIPKVHYTTNNNMSVYGIDALFYSKEHNLLLFGESKFCANLTNGIELVNKSLKKYSEQIKEEYRLVLSGRILKTYPSIFNERFGEARDISSTIEEFIEEANITQIGIPIFIVHGKDIDEKNILENLRKVKQKDFFSLRTIYYFISLPVINKENLMSCFRQKINEKLREYKNAG